MSRAARGVAHLARRHRSSKLRRRPYALEREPERIAALLRAELLVLELGQLGLDDRALVESAHPSATSAHELASAALGILPERLRRELREVALREVVTPCGLGLLRHRAGAVAENQVLSA